MNLSSLKTSISKLPRVEALSIIRNTRTIRRKKKEIPAKKSKPISSEEAVLLLELLKEKGLYVEEQECN